MRKKYGFGISVILVNCAFVVLSLMAQTEEPKSQKEGNKMLKTEVVTLEIRSEAFNAGDTIPEKFTCDGQDVSPTLSWSKVPDGTRELALVVEDPDAPRGTYIHWILYGMPPDITNLSENVPKNDTLKNGAMQGKNSFGKIGYGGPCPPQGSTHRYYFRLYALDKNLNLRPKITKDDIMKAMEGHIIAQGELMGRYGR